MTDSAPPTQGADSPPPSRTNELTVLAEFIGSHAQNPFDRHLSALLAETGNHHDTWSQNCAVPHWESDFPCEEFERGVSLGIAWLKARIEGEAANAS